VAEADVDVTFVGPEGMEGIFDDAESGDPEAQYLLGKSFMDGEVVTVNEKWALHWIGKAAEQDHPKAQLQLGMWYLNGVGVDEDLAASAAWVSAAANQGLPEAQFQIAMMLLAGMGVEANGQWAKYWLEKAAQQEGAAGANALYRIGVMYESGQEVEQDFIVAMTYFEQACARGNTQACVDVQRIGRAGHGAGKTLCPRNTPGLPGEIRRNLWGGKGW